MNDETVKPITQLLANATGGDADAQKQLWSVIYSELHRLAKAQMVGEGQNRTLQTTSLIHETYLRLFANQELRWDNRRHFFGSAARAMRQILVENARRRGAQKRGGGRKREPLSDAGAMFDEDPSQVMALDEALSKLEKTDSRKAEIMNLRFFGGLSVDETAAALDLSPRTIENDSRFARAWLRRELTDADGALPDAE